MTSREWKRLERAASLDAFLLWILEQPDGNSWSRECGDSCPLHDFVETVAGISIGINSPELHEHWDERPSQRWPTPWWMTWIMRSVDHVGEGRIDKDELLMLSLIMVDRDFQTPLLSAKDFEIAVTESFQ